MARTADEIVSDWDYGPEILAELRMAGFVLVLREPSLAAQVAGKRALYRCSEDPELEDARACWNAMIAEPPVDTVCPSTGKAEPPPGWVGEDGK